MRRLLLALLVPSLAAPLDAQEPTRVTADDYARAERFLSAYAEPLVLGSGVTPRWLPDGRFWYSVRVQGGTEHVTIDPEARTRSLAFDHTRLAEALSAVSGVRHEALALPIASFTPDGSSARIGLANGAWYACDLAAYRCRAEGPPPSAGRDEVLSPDGRFAAFLRGYDLWARELATGAEIRLTDDGAEDLGYATNNAGWVRSDRPVLKWSPDSRLIATFRHDARGVGMMYVTSTNVGHPELDAWRYPLPEDSVIFRIHRVVVDLDRPEGDRVVPLDMEPDQHRSTVCDHVYCGGTFADVEWSADSERLVFVSSSRDHKSARVRIADASTGAVRDLFEETEETFFESGGNWRYLSASDQVLWYSQRDDWGHLYLYDTETGSLERQVTRGEWNVDRIVEVDEARQEVVFSGVGREPGDPYFEYLYRLDLDDGEVRLLTPDSANHQVSLSPDGQYLVDEASTPVEPSVTVLRDRDGRSLLTLEEADITALRAGGWQPPLPFVVKARDGVTDLYGLMFRPTRFDPSRRYPVINYLYPGPQSGSVGGRSFRAAHRDLQSLAELGFVVVELDAMGTPGRSKAFHEAYYGNMGDNGLPDQVSGIRQLADLHLWIDVDRVGIFGHSGGGFAAAGAIFRYPGFYDVAVAQAGNHDNRNYEDDWGEKWQGLLVEYPDGTTSYDNQSNALQAHNLEGKLLIAHGTADTNVPMSNTMLVVDALIAANKDFDLVLFPNRGHGFGNEPYMMRRRWDYFVRHLLGAEPPREYEFGKLEGGPF